MGNNGIAYVMLTNWHYQWVGERMLLHPLLGHGSASQGIRGGSDLFMSGVCVYGATGRMKPSHRPGHTVQEGSS
eukprot:scaffold32363_cov41-Attheya_sp.AAC.2